jgi:hypothetical protein
MTVLANSPVFWIGLLAGLAALYVLPTAIAVIRHVENIALVVFLNCFPIAWPAALIVACMMPRREDGFDLSARA